ncbi:MAG: hypothetical protein WC456_05020 [Patescibacteria group bacterium]
MSTKRQSLFSLLYVVVFLVLIAIAAVLYGSGQEEKAKREQNFFWQKVFSAWDAAKPVLQNVVDFGLGKESSNTIAAPAVSEIASTAGDDAAETPGFWSKMAAGIKAEWQKSDSDVSDPAMSTVLDEAGPQLLRWEKTATGAAIILQTKNGSEHKLPLPFKFLSR